MARKASSRKPTLALPKPFARSPTSRGKSARGLSAPEAADAAQQGLLQLSFARHAHGYGFVGAAAFLLDAILILYIGLQSQSLVLPTGGRRIVGRGAPEAGAVSEALRVDPFRHVDRGDGLVLRHRACDRPHDLATVPGMARPGLGLPLRRRWRPA